MHVLPARSALADRCVQDEVAGHITRSATAAAVGVAEEGASEVVMTAATSSSNRAPGTSTWSSRELAGLRRTGHSSTRI